MTVKQKNIKTKLNAPFGWVGGKSKLANDIIKLIPEHKTYIEVFGGAGSVLYKKEPSKLEIFNDINSELINLHRIIRNNPQSLSIYLNDLLISRQIFEDIKEGALKGRNNIEKAAFYFYQLLQSFGSKGTHFAMAAKAGRNPKNIYKNFKNISQRLKFVTIENVSYDKLIPLYDKDDSFFYLDPPYLGTESYYKNTGAFKIKEHEKLADLLSKLKGKFLLSYNDHPKIRELYKDFNIQNSKEINYILGEKFHKKKKIVNELFIANY